MKPMRNRRSPKTVEWWDTSAAVTPIDGGRRLSQSGWNAPRGVFVEPGDYLLLPLHRDDPRSPLTRYRVIKMTYHFDPPDMYSFTAEFAPRTAHTNGGLQ